LTQRYSLIFTASIASENFSLDENRLFSLRIAIKQTNGVGEMKQNKRKERKEGIKSTIEFHLFAHHERYQITTRK
jgi:hypothetical protein